MRATILLLAFLASAAAEGSWRILQTSIGISAMHMQLLWNDRVIIFDRTDFGQSNLSLPAGVPCRDDPTDRALKHDCSAHSVEYNVPSNSFRPLTLLTDTWCSSATVSPDGRLYQTGGFNDGQRAVRIFPSSSCDWSENISALSLPRWYASNHILPDGRAIIVGGRRQFNYEFYPPLSSPYSATGSVHPLPFLSETKDSAENNLYPFLHLSVDGNLFLFANNRAVLLDYNNGGRIVRTYPEMPGGDPRNYPSSGSSVLLPLDLDSKEPQAEVLICGGAPRGSYDLASRNGTFVRALSTCGRIKITDSFPTWQMETMPAARVMGDMILLPTGAHVLVINGAEAGTAGWELGREPALSPVMYRLNGPAGSRFEVQSPASIPRMYHSTAVLLRDGRVLVGGSNPHVYYNFSGVRFPTELSLEAFSPEYLDLDRARFRPEVASEGRLVLELGYGKEFVLRFRVSVLWKKAVTVTMAAPGFSTHSFSMSQRLLILASKEVKASAGEGYEVVAAAPARPEVAPPGYYMLFVVNEGVPSVGLWVHIQRPQIASSANAKSQCSI